MTTIHFGQLKLAERWGLSTATLNAGARTAPVRSTSGYLERLSTVCAMSRHTKTSASFHRLPSSESTRSCLRSIAISIPKPVIGAMSGALNCCYISLNRIEQIREQSEALRPIRNA